MTSFRRSGTYDVASGNAAVQAGSAVASQMTGPVIEPGSSPGGVDPQGGTTVLDVVIQRLFALGLTVQSVAKSLDDERAAKLIEVVAGIDTTIREVRTQMMERADRGPEPVPPASAGSTL